MIPDVEATCLCHLLLQEGVPLTPQQQHRRPDMILAQGERAKGRTEERGKKVVFTPMRCILEETDISSLLPELFIKLDVQL